MDAQPEALDVQALPRGPYSIAPEIVAADQRRRLLAAAPLVIARYGLEATTVEQIVKAARVRRNSFYEQFEGKRDYIASAYEIAQERLLGAITFQCYSRTGPGERIAAALTAALELLAAGPATARLLMLEAPVAGVELVARHHEWLDRYGRMLRFAAIGNDGVGMPSPSIESAIVGGIASRIRESILAGDTERLPDLGPELTAFATSFYGSVEVDLADELFESEQPQSPGRRAATTPVVAV
jgi:AcrR family transcriptional regulator